MAELVVAPCSAEAASLAVKRWHYSRRMPTPPIVRFGAWEDGKFVGVVLFGRGANRHLFAPYGLDTTEGAELVRIAMRMHEHPVSEITARAIERLRENSPGLRLLISFADPAQGHHGGIYQAMNWIYVGRSADSPAFRDKLGRIHHPRVVSKDGWKKQYGVYKPVPKYEDVERVTVPGKYRYLLPLDKAMRRKVRKLALPYPAREVSEGNADLPDQRGEFDPRPSLVAK